MSNMQVNHGNSWVGTEYLSQSAPRIVFQVETEVIIPKDVTSISSMRISEVTAAYLGL